MITITSTGSLSIQFFMIPYNTFKSMLERISRNVVRSVNLLEEGHSYITAIKIYLLMCWFEKTEEIIDHIPNKPLMWFSSLLLILIGPRLIIISNTHFSLTLKTNWIQKRFLHNKENSNHCVSIVLMAYYIWSYSEQTEKNEHRHMPKYWKGFWRIYSAFSY